MDEIGIELEEWVGGYIHAIYNQRGYIGPQYKQLKEAQIPYWIKLMLEKGLAQNRRLAEKVAYEFAFVENKGGIGKLFELFAGFLERNPTDINRVAEERYEVSQGHKCRLCNNLGVVMVPVVRHKDGETRRSKRAYACTCEVGKNRYSGLIMINSEIADHLRAEEQQEYREACDWMRDRGLPLKPTFGELWRHLLSGDGRKQAKIRPEQNEQRLSLQAYYNGDERGYLE
jgi:hypothetical protein